MTEKEENPFADVAEMAAEPTGETQSSTDMQEPNQVPVEPTRSEETESEGSSDSLSYTEPVDSNARPVEKSMPSFDWSDTNQIPIYVLEETELDLDDFKHDVQGKLRREYGIRNAENRELDNAIIRAVVDEFGPAQIAQLIVEKRGYKP